MTFRAPIEDFQFVFKHLSGLPQLLELPVFSEAQFDLIDAVLEENAKFTEEVVAPTNRIGDSQPPVCQQGVVTMPQAFHQAFTHFTQGGWQGLRHPQQWGGQGLPKALATATTENLYAANVAFSLCPMLTDGVIEALLLEGSDEQKRTYVEALVAGKWTGTMNLTEPQAGSDLSMVATRAQPQPDGTYRLFGQKIYITYGEHDLAENIIHLVLARTADAPPGVKGLSLFVVPKYLVNADGSLGPRNDVWCASIEHKLGIHSSPTAVLLFGDGKGDVGNGAIGTLVGQENRGLEYMFIMMNAARFAVGVQGIGVSEAATQKALSYARDRIQSRAIEGHKLERLGNRDLELRSLARHERTAKVLLPHKPHVSRIELLALVGNLVEPLLRFLSLLDSPQPSGNDRTQELLRDCRIVLSGQCDHYLRPFGSGSCFGADSTSSLGMKSQQPVWRLTSGCSLCHGSVAFRTPSLPIRVPPNFGKRTRSATPSSLQAVTTAAYGSFPTVPEL